MQNDRPKQPPQEPNTSRPPADWQVTDPGQYPDPNAPAQPAEKGE
jgi:hypothetical protein